MVAFYVFSSLNINQRHVITCVFSFLCHFVIFPYLHFQFVQKSHLSLLFCVEKQLHINVRQQSTHIHANVYQSCTVCTYDLLYFCFAPRNQQFFCLPVKSFCLLYIMPARYYLSVLFSMVAQYIHPYNIANQMHSFADDRWTEKTTIWTSNHIDEHLPRKNRQIPTWN